jgi:hypothetical protein
MAQYVLIPSLLAVKDSKTKRARDSKRSFQSSGLYFESWSLSVFASLSKNIFPGPTSQVFSPKFPLALDSEPFYTCRTLHKTLTFDRRGKMHKLVYMAVDNCNQVVYISLHE